MGGLWTHNGSAVMNEDSWGQSSGLFAILIENDLRAAMTLM